jgi:hypothetical protein
VCALVPGGCSGLLACLASFDTWYALGREALLHYEAVTDRGLLRQYLYNCVEKINAGQAVLPAMATTAELLRVCESTGPKQAGPAPPKRVDRPLFSSRGWARACQPGSVWCA